MVGCGKRSSVVGWEVSIYFVVSTAARLEPHCIHSVTEQLASETFVSFRVSDARWSHRHTCSLVRVTQGRF